MTTFKIRLSTVSASWPTRKRKRWSSLRKMQTVHNPTKINTGAIWERASTKEVMLPSSYSTQVRSKRFSVIVLLLRDVPRSLSTWKTRARRGSAKRRKRELSFWQTKDTERHSLIHWDCCDNLKTIKSPTQKRNRKIQPAHLKEARPRRGGSLECGLAMKTYLISKEFTRLLRWRRRNQNQQMITNLQPSIMAQNSLSQGL